MRRIALILMLALILPVLWSCGPGISPDIEAATGYELLFELPEGCSIVSESFSLSTEDPGYTGNYHAEAMLVTASYTIENAGSAAVMTALVPAPEAESALAYHGFYYRLEIDYEGLDGTWMMRYPTAGAVVYADYAAGMSTLAGLAPDVAIYRSTFLAPLLGETANVMTDAGSRLIVSTSYQTFANYFVIDSESQSSQEFIYSFGAPATLRFDYDAEVVTTEVTFTEMLVDFARTHTYNQGIYAIAVARFLASDQTTTQRSELFPVQRLSGIESAFQYEITLPAGTSTVTLTQPIWATCHMIEESCVYRFAFDEERYLETTFPVSITLATQRSIESSTYPCENGVLLFDSQRSLLEIDTLAKRSVGSLGKLPTVSVAPF